MSSRTAFATEKMVFRATHRHTGRLISVTPGNSANRHLTYGRILLNRSCPSVSFNNREEETGLICLSGSGMVTAERRSFPLSQYDALYIPRDSAIEVSTAEALDVAEFSAPVEHRYPLQFIPYEEISKNPALQFNAGAPGNARRVTICFGKNVQAGRLMAGFTFSEPGNWTSWPPHEHTRMLEEMYVFFNMPAPAFGLQLVYNETDYPELVVPVRDGDAVLMPSGYHPNVAIPGHTIGFLWAMAAHREKEDRQFGVVNVQPEFSAGGSGLEASRR